MGNKIFVTNLAKKKQKHMEDQYYDIQRRTEIKDTAREYRKKYLRYEDGEIVYSITHKKLLELAGKAYVIYKIDGYVFINWDIFDEYREQFREETNVQWVKTVVLIPLKPTQIKDSSKDVFYICTQQYMEGEQVWRVLHGNIPVCLMIMIQLFYSMTS